VAVLFLRIHATAQTTMMINFFIASPFDRRVEPALDQLERIDDPEAVQNLRSSVVLRLAGGRDIESLTEPHPDPTDKS
jgi:hypothetical protein